MRMCPRDGVTKEAAKMSVTKINAICLCSNNKVNMKLTWNFHTLPVIDLINSGCMVLSSNPCLFLLMDALQIPFVCHLYACTCHQIKESNPSIYGLCTMMILMAGHNKKWMHHVYDICQQRPVNYSFILWGDFYVVNAYKCYSISCCFSQLHVPIGVCMWWYGECWIWIKSWDR